MITCIIAEIIAFPLLVITSMHLFIISLKGLLHCSAASLFVPYEKGAKPRLLSDNVITKNEQKLGIGYEYIHGNMWRQLIEVHKSEDKLNDSNN